MRPPHKPGWMNGRRTNRLNPRPFREEKARMPRRYKLVVSDFHCGKGQTPGHLNPFESFTHDDKFAEFLRFYSTDYFEDEEVELIINGDFYDFLMVQVAEKFPEKVTEEIALEKVRACIAGHPKAHKALQDFVRTPRKRVTVLPGNHDFDLVYPRVQEAFREAICGARADPRVQFVCDREYYEFDGIQVHHGMQFESFHYHNFREQFLTSHGGDPILNLPWGSVFILKVLSRLKEQRPYVDRVRPFWAYFVRSLIYDPFFAVRVGFLTFWYFLKTRVFALRNLRARIRQNLIMLQEAEVYPDLIHKVRHVFDQHPDVHTVILGHTHVPLLRRFEGGRVYINIGCWTPTVSLEMDSFGRESKLTYGFIEYPESGGRPTVALREWHGYHELFRDLYI
jgi:UDP-2,3-diacylglucosamine pyrophosphatase LpxH